MDLSKFTEKSQAALQGSPRRTGTHRTLPRSMWCARDTTRCIGARPLERFLQRHIETVISRKILAGEIQGPGKVKWVSYNAEAGPREFTRLARAVEEARLRVPIAAVYPLEKAAQAHQRLHQGQVLGRYRPANTQRG